MHKRTHSTIQQRIFRQSMSICQHIRPNFHVAGAKTAISELLIKILTPPLDSAPRVSI